MSPNSKQNYIAWQLDTKNYPGQGSLYDKIKFLLRFAILAPSGHNTQPWLFSLSADNLKVFLNPKRLLKQNDSQGRQTYISMGCLIENLLIACDYYGLRANIQYFPEPTNSELVASITFEPAKEAVFEPGHLINYIPLRSASRFKYKPEKPSSEIIQDLIATKEGATGIFATQGEQKNTLAKFMVESQIEVMKNAQFREELSHYIKSNYTRDFYGMPGFTLAMPGPVSLIASKLIKKFNMSAVSKKQDEELLTKHTPIIFVIATQSDGKIDWINAGKALESLWLKCTRRQLSCSPLAGAVQVHSYRKKIQELLNTAMYPQAIVRCGFSNPAPHSPRFSLEALLLKSS